MHGPHAIQAVLSGVAWCYAAVGRSARELMAFQPVHDFAVLLRRHRLLAGLSQEELAERARLSVRGISDLERGVRRAPHPGTIARLADALDLDVAAREALLLSTTAPARTAPDPIQLPQAAAISEPLREPGADGSAAQERRWVTVLAVQLGGFAPLAAQIDPEDLHALADRYADTISDHVRRFDGTVLRTTGDGILAVFGAPTAHEDDAERALRAGLAIQDCRLSLPPASHGAQVQVGVGIHTGEVVAGLQGPDMHRHYTVSG